MSTFAENARAATAKIRSLFPPTPLQRNDHLSDRFGAEILLKREDLAPVRSYKLRGVFNAMRKVLDERPGQDLFVCASAGNHAQGAAYVCRHFGVRGIVFMPVTTPQQKIQKTRILGGNSIEIRLTGDYFDDTLSEVQAWCVAQGGHFLAPFEDADVIEGQASVMVEVLDEIGPPDMMILPVGGGGLSAGVTRYVDEIAPIVGLRYVEPNGGASLTAAVTADHPVTLDRVCTFVDGAAVARIGELPFQTLDRVASADVLLASEDRICTTIIEMLNVEGAVLEHPGALSVDVLPDLSNQIRGRRVVCVTSGGKFDFERLPEVMERAQRRIVLTLDRSGLNCFSPDRLLS